jgi:DNA-binding NtrC family response regulator
MKKPSVLLVCADPGWRQALRNIFASGHLEMAECPDRGMAALCCDRIDPAIVVFASPSRHETGKDIGTAAEMRRDGCHRPMLLLAAESSEDIAVAALRGRMDDLIRYPQGADELPTAISRVLARWPQPAMEDQTDPIIGSSKSMWQLKAYLAKVAATDSNVLITGETGTGKELAAGMLHRWSPRRTNPFVSVNCAAIPASLIESEFFGHERGAFTGAHISREGKFQLADGGTVFLDEIGDMDLGSQAKLLRVIENKEVHSLGAKASHRVDVRVIAATNQDPEQMVSENRFRKDLYFRLNVARVHLTPLRERKQDIRPLVEQSIRDLNRRFGYQVEGCTEDAWSLLDRYDWPGNVRELKNLMEASFIGLESRVISAGDIPESFHRRLEVQDRMPADERKQLIAALSATNWNKSKAAEALHWSRMTVYRKIAKYHLSIR